MPQPSLFPVDTRLTISQKWRVALSLTLIYYPILVYLNYVHGEFSWLRLARMVPSVVLGGGVILLALRGWVHAVEWIQVRLYRWLGEEFSLTMRWPGQLLTVGICVGLSVAFILVFGHIVTGIDWALTRAGWPVPTGGGTPSNTELWHRSLDGYFLMLMLSVFYLLANSRAQQRLVQMSQRSQQLETQNVQVQLAALKNQVNPHFLFNSLSILSSLVHVDAELSEKFIDQLARAYRYTLEQQHQDVVPLHTELAFIQSYTFLLKIRFNEKFDVVLDVPEAARIAYAIAPLTLQLLIENAVKHNTMSLAKPLSVCIVLEGNTLVIRNTLQRRAATYASTGVGLANILNRYRLLTDRPVQVSEAAQAFEVRIPLLPA